MRNVVICDEEDKSLLLILHSLKNGPKHHMDMFEVNSLG